MIKIIKKSNDKEYLLSEVSQGDTFRLASGCGGLYAKLQDLGTETLCYSFYQSGTIRIFSSEKCILVDCEVHWEDRE